jgi:hypothetical protein
MLLDRWTLQQQQSKWKMLSHRAYAARRISPSFIQCLCSRQWIHNEAPFPGLGWGYNTWVTFFLFLELFFLDWLGLRLSGSSGCIPQMRDQGHIIPLQQIRPTNYEEQPRAYLQFLWDQFGTVAPYPTAQNPPRVGLCAIAGCSQTQFQLEGVALHTIAADVGLLSTILVHKTYHGS